MRIVISIFLIGLVSFSFSQTEKLNQLDAAGKKNGKWIVYLDTKWNKVDSNKAVYYRYTWFDHGINIHPMGPAGGKNYKMETSIDSFGQSGKIKLLDGEYKWYNDKGQLQFTHVLKNGEYILYKKFYPTGQLQTFFGYTKQCDGQPHSWMVFTYDKKRSLITSSPTCKDEKGNWPKMRDK